MESNIRCSVVIATYNGEKYIQDQIKSILININDRNAKKNAAKAIGGNTKIKSEAENLLNIKIADLQKKQHYNLKSH